MSSIGEGLLEKDIKSVLNAKDKNPSPRANKYGISLHTVDIDMSIVFFTDLFNHGDYEHKYSDELVVRMSMPMGDYIYDIYPHRDNFEVSLTKETTEERITVRYKGVLINSTSIPDNGIYNKASRENLNGMEMVTLDIQLLDRYTEAIRSTNIDGVYNFCTVGNAIKAGIAECSSKIKVGGKPLQFNLQMQEPNNTFLYKHIEVPTGTDIVNFPTYLQQSQYGVYNGDIGVYNKMYGKDNINTLFVYPIYSNSAFDKAKNKLIVYKSSNPNIDHVENTYFIDGDILKVVAGNETMSLDISDGNMINHGGDVAVTSPDTAIQRNNVVSKDGKSGSYAETNLDVKTNKVRKDKSNKFNYKGNDSNPYKHRASVLKSSARHFRIIWNFSNPDLIFPGMPVMYCYEKNNEIIKLYGTVTKFFTKFNIGKYISDSIIEITTIS